MSFTAWRQLSREQRRAWSVISGIVVVGTVVKVRAVLYCERGPSFSPRREKIVDALGEPPHFVSRKELKITVNISSPYHSAFALGLKMQLTIILRFCVGVIMR